MDKVIRSSASCATARRRPGMMLRILLSILPVIALCSAPSAMAQRHYVPHVHVGVHGGMSMSTVSFFPSIKDRMLSGMQFGVAFRYAEERHVGLVAELNLEQRGWAEDFSGTPLTYSHRTTYVELPVLTHIFFGSRVVKCFINLGPEIGYMISNKIDSNFDYHNPSGVEGFPDDNRHVEQMKMEITNKFDYGITAGAGVEFVIRKRHSLMLEGRYYYGLGNIFPSTKKDYFSSSRGSSILVTLGYMFRIK